jgi:hypothetical protein
VLAGVFAGLAAWTKDEGLLFLLLFLLAIALWRRKTIVASIAGAMPAGLLALIFRMTLPRGSSSLLAASAHGAAHRLAELSRNGDILMAFAKGFAGMGVGWYHPVEPIIVAAIVLRFHRGRARDAAFAGAIGLALLLGYFGVYAVTSNDLSWQLSTSLDRLLVQVWPLLAVAAFLGMRAPRTAPAPAAPSKKSRRKATHAR